MFGTDAGAWRKQVGYTLDRLPSLHESDARLNGGTVDLDKGRLQHLARLMVERTRRSLPALWAYASYGEESVVFGRLCERLSSSGVGVFSHRELGVLQRGLMPSSDGVVRRAQWEAAFAEVQVGAVAQAEAAEAPAAGMPSVWTTIETALPSMHDEIDPVANHGQPVGIHNSTVVTGGTLPAGAPPPTPGANETWPGGFHKAALAEDAARNAVAVDENWQQHGGPQIAPYANQQTPQVPVNQPRVEMLNSPTFHPTIERPPFATRGSFGGSDLDAPHAAHAPPALAPAPSQLGEPFGTDRNALPTPASPRVAVTTPYASGGNFASAQPVGVTTGAPGGAPGWRHGKSDCWNR